MQCIRSNIEDSDFYPNAGDSHWQVLPWGMARPSLSFQVFPWLLYAQWIGKAMKENEVCWHTPISPGPRNAEMTSRSLYLALSTVFLTGELEVGIPTILSLVLTTLLNGLLTSENTYSIYWFMIRDSNEIKRCIEQYLGGVWGFLNCLELS